MILKNRNLCEYIRHKRMPIKNEYTCDLCDFICGTKRLYNQHLKTFKHRLAIKDPNLDISCMIKCNDCGDMFGSRTTLWRHKKSCQIESKNITHNDEGMKQEEYMNNKKLLNNKNTNKTFRNQTKLLEEDIDVGILNEVLTETKNLRKAFLEQNKTIEDLKKVNEEQHRIIEESLPMMGTTNNITNVMNNCSQNFNINLFLNENCKDAINLSEFVKSIVVQIDDLERTKSLGFVKGVTDIIVRSLKQLDVCSRPIHCSDPLQEIMYVKNDNIWAEDTQNKPMVRGAINAVAKMQIEKVREWEEHNTGWQGSEEGTSEYITLVRQATSMENEEQNRILKNIAREVVLSKTS